MRVAALLLAAGGACAALAVAVTGAVAATPNTRYDVVAVESPGDRAVSTRFGERLTAAGDLTGDGVPDVFTPTVKDVDGVEDAGTVMLISGATQKVVYEVTSPEVQKSAKFGFYISVPGDVNGDGRDDLAVGTNSQDVDGNVDQGKMYVFDGPTGKLEYGIDNPEPQARGSFGARIGSAGDVTGDGLADILVGANANDVPAGCGNEAPVPDDCRINQGRAYIFDGSDGSLVRTLNIPDEDLPPTTCSQTGDCGGLGIAPQVIGDLNGDGVPDQMVPATNLRPDPSRRGVMYVFSGANGKVLTRIEQPVPQTSGSFGFQDADRFAPGDLTGDGVPEIYVTGWTMNGPNGEFQAGRAWVFDGAKSLETGAGVVLYEVEGPRLAPARGFGWSMSKTDYNKDGTPDLYVGNASADDHETYVFDGRDGSLLKTLGMPRSEVQRREPGNSGSALGWASRAPGDLNGDGEPDYVGGAPFHDVAGVQDQGRVYFFLSNVRQAPPAGQAPAGQAPAGQAPPVSGGSCGVEGSPGYLFASKMRVSRVRVLGGSRRLDVFAPITSRAEGGVKVRFLADGRVDSFSAQVRPGNSVFDQVRVLRRVTRGQARLGTGIVTLDYRGDGDTRPEFVRLRAAAGRADLEVDQISLKGDRLSARGSVTRRAEGIVRLRYSYLDEAGRPRLHKARARIQEDGDWRLSGNRVPAQLARCGGYLSVQFTGYLPRRVRGEQLAYQLNAGQTRRP